MSKQNTIDDVFRNGLGSYQEPYDPGAWEQMQHTLDNTPRKPILFFVLFRKKNLPYTLSVIPMILLYLIFFYNTNPVQKAADTRAEVTTSHNPTPAVLKTSDAISQNSVPNTTLPVRKTTKPAVTTPGATQKPSVNPSPATVKSLVTALPVEPIFAGFPQISAENNISRTQGNTPAPRSGHYNCAHGGLHVFYTMPQGNYAAAGQKPGFGFDFEGYSRNLTRTLPVGLFVGGNIGFSLLDKSVKQDALLISNQGTPAVTYLQNNRFHLNLRAKAELGKGDLKFYGLGYVGFNTFFVDQHIDFTNTQSNNNNTSKNVWNTTLPAWGGGAGIRYHVAPGVSFDMNVAYHNSTGDNLVNVYRSDYNSSTGNYSLSKFGVKPQSVSIQFGILFCMHKSSTSSYGTSVNPGIIIMPVPGSAPRPSGNSNTRPAPRPAPQTRPAPSRAPSKSTPSRPANPRVIPR